MEKQLKKVGEILKISPTSTPLSIESVFYQNNAIKSVFQMAYSNFTIAKLKQQFGLTQENVHIFEQTRIATVRPSRRLVIEIKEGNEMPLMSEKAK